MAVLHCDFETYSACDLKTAGLDNYAKHPSTGVHCMAYAFGDAGVCLWAPGMMSPDALDHVDAGGIVYAHNAAFELAIWNNVCVPKYGWPPLNPKQVRCTMAMAYAMSLPGSLEKAAAALDIAEQKDVKGARVMMQLAQPTRWRELTEEDEYVLAWRNDEGEVPVFWTPADSPEKFEQLYGYCRQDVRVERALHQRMMELSDSEQALWELDYAINQRGIQIDLPSVNAAISLVNSEKARLDKEMLRVTCGVVGRCTEVQLLIKWIRAQGVVIKGVAKADVLDALDGDLPNSVRAALSLRKEAAKSSTAKLIAMRDAASSDGRVRGTMQYHGANTGRWAGRRVQFQNVPRGGLKPKEIEDCISHFHDGAYINMMYAPPLDVVVSCLRAMVVPKAGHDLVAADFSNIEGRVLAWLAGEEWKLQAFRDFDAGTGPDLYNLIYAESFGIDVKSVTKDQRQVGKVEELAFGFGGGVGAGQSMARIYGVKVHDETMDGWKKAWRAKHPRVVHYWSDLESAAINAVELGVVCKAGPAGRQVQYKKSGSFLWCKLPSGRVLCYPYPVVKDTPVPWGGTKPALHYMSVNGLTNKWEETNTYGGSLAENVTQAVARDLLAHSLKSLEQHGYPVVMHVHDEAVVEIPSVSDDDALERIESIMSNTPAWAVGLPVTAEGWRAKRYRK